MPIYYKGAAPRTHWHDNDPIHAGAFTSWSSRPIPAHDTQRVVRHIVGRAPQGSPYISFSRSYGVAWNYAAQPNATANAPGYVYEIDLPDTLPPGLELYDPVAEIARKLPSSSSLVTYQHEGDQKYLLGVMAYSRFQLRLQRTDPEPPPGGGLLRTPRDPSDELKSIVLALRDAEVLVRGEVNSGHWTHIKRHKVWP